MLKPKWIGGMGVVGLAILPVLAMAGASDDIIPNPPVPPTVAALATQPELPVPCKNPRLRNDATGRPTIHQLNVKGCDPLLIEEVVCDSDQPGQPAEAMPMICSPLDGGGAPTASACVAKSKKKQFPQVPGDDSITATAGGPACSLRSPDQLPVGSAKLYGMFYRQLPASACGQANKGITLQYLNCSPQGSLASHISLAACGYDDKGTSFSISACLGDQNVTLGKYNPPVPAGPTSNGAGSGQGVSGKAL